MVTVTIISLIEVYTASNFGIVWASHTQCGKYLKQIGLQKLCPLIFVKIRNKDRLYVKNLGLLSEIF